MKNPNSKEDLIAIIERLFEEVYDYQNGDGPYTDYITLDEKDARLEDEIEKLEYEFLNGSK